MQSTPMYYEIAGKAIGFCMILWLLIAGVPGNYGLPFLTIMACQIPPNAWIWSSKSDFKMKKSTINCIVFEVNFHSS